MTQCMNDQIDKLQKLIRYDYNLRSRVVWVVVRYVLDFAVGGVRAGLSFTVSASKRVTKSLSISSLVAKSLQNTEKGRIKRHPNDA